MERVPSILAAIVLTAALAAGYGLAAGSPSTAGASGAGGTARAAGAASAPTSPFADVPPCHWAAKAVTRVTQAGLFEGFPPDPAYDSVNALRQVFEGLKCGQPAWSAHFLAGAPGAFTNGGGVSLAGFQLKSSIVSLSSQRARIAFQLTAVIDQNGARRTVERQGTVTATHAGAGWQVPYAELASLGLPIFPR